MSPKKSSSKKPASSRSASRKKSAKSVTSGDGKPATRKMTTKKPSKKPTPLNIKPDEMPPEVLEFIQAIDDYKRLEGRPFPTWSEVLDIVKGLGYERKAS